jgi:DNA-binding CsgD family transcriptional regulator
MTDAKRPCTHTTKSGHRCKACADHGTEPPACSIQAGLTRGGPAERNQDARKHGFYAPGISRDELRDLIYLPEDLGSIDDEIIVAKIALMTPLELLIAQARIDGLSDTEIAERMQLSPNAITKHMTRLRRRIHHRLPELRPLLAGRRYRSPLPY